MSTPAPGYRFSHHDPPTSSFFSSTTCGTPASVSRVEASIPAIPAPITTAVGPLSSGDAGGAGYGAASVPVTISSIIGANSWGTGSPMVMSRISASSSAGSVRSGGRPARSQARTASTSPARTSSCTAGSRPPVVLSSIPRLRVGW